jgi:hypothetical protein
LRTVRFDHGPDLLAVVRDLVHSVPGAECVHEEPAAFTFGVRSRQRGRPVQVFRECSLGRLIVDVHPHSPADPLQGKLDRGLPVAHRVRDQLREDQGQAFHQGLQRETPHEPSGLLSSYAGGADVVGKVLPLRGARFITWRGARVNLSDHVIGVPY